MSETFLILEDDVVFAQTLARGLTRRGYQVHTCHDGASALRIASEQEIRYITVDLHLAQDSGLQWIAKLRNAAPQARIVVLTGYASIASTVTAMKAGADNYLPKPANIDAILSALQIDNTGQVPPIETARALENHPVDEYECAPHLEAAMSVRRLEWEHIQRVLQEHGGNISSAARALHMHRRSLQRKLAKKPSAK